ncbi:MAG: acyl-ACP thioesterase [Proteobacteria bacterium]|nr:acyl-ACP thioesterase [Pseudomonadota bacterium]
MTTAEAPSLEIWRGAVNAWECDEMGHMNVRFYLAHAHAGLAGLAAAMGLPDAFSPTGGSTLIIREQHVRFLREAHAGAPLHMHAGLLNVGEQEAEALLVMRHSESGEPCASFIVRLVHATAAGRAFPWTTATLNAAERLACTRPDFAGARGVPDDAAVEPRASTAMADELGVPSIGRGPVTPQDCDAFGRLRPDAVMARFSDGAAQLFGGVPRGGKRPGQPRLGGALLEIRILHLQNPRAGRHLSLRSGFSRLEPRFSHITHWLLDAITGEPVASARGIAAALDLDARKVAERSPETLTELQSKVIEGFGF